MKLLAAVLVLLLAPLAFAQPRWHRAHTQVVGYYPQWGVYSNWFAGNLVRSGAMKHLTQINYAQGFIRDGQCVIADPNADLNLAYTAANSVDGVADELSAALKGNFHQMQKLRRMYPHIHLLLSLEGRAADFAKVARPEIRASFVKSCIDRFVEGHLADGIEAPRLFDGFDVDWEYPNEGNAEDYIALLTEFRHQLDAAHKSLLLSIAAGGTKGVIDDVDWKRVSPFVDEIGVMTYDFNGPWSHRTGFVAPLRVPNPKSDSAAVAIDEFVTRGATRSKLLLGIPFYAYQWTDVPAGDNNGFDQPGRSVRGHLTMASVKEAQTEPDAKVLRDPVSQSPWIYDGKNFFTYDDPTSLAAKARYVHDEKLGGVMIWELSGDSEDAALLRALSPKR